MYVDGVEQMSLSLQITVSYDSDSIMIGEDYGDPGSYFDGVIDEVYIFSVAIPLSEIVTLKN